MRRLTQPTLYGYHGYHLPVPHAQTSSWSLSKPSALPAQHCPFQLWRVGYLSNWKLEIANLGIKIQKGGQQVSTAWHIFVYFLVLSHLNCKWHPTWHSSNCGKKKWRTDRAITQPSKAGRLRQSHSTISWGVGSYPTTLPIWSLVSYLKVLEWSWVIIQLCGFFEV